MALIKTLSELECLFDGVAPENATDVFGTLYPRAVELLELSDEVAAKLFDTSRPNVSRWRRGVTVPPAAHMVLRFLHDAVVNRLSAERAWSAGPDADACGATNGIVIRDAIRGRRRVACVRSAGHVGNHEFERFSWPQEQDARIVRIPTVWSTAEQKRIDALRHAIEQVQRALAEPDPISRLVTVSDIVDAALAADDEARRPR